MYTHLYVGMPLSCAFVYTGITNINIVVASHMAPVQSETVHFISSDVDPS